MTQQNSANDHDSSRSTTATSVTFRLQGRDLAPDDISAHLGITPSETFIKGQHLHDNPTYPAYERSGWILQSDAAQADDIEAHITQLTTPLLPHIDYILSLAEQYQADFECDIYVQSSVTKVRLMPQTIDIIAQFGAALNLTTYSSS